MLTSADYNGLCRLDCRSDPQRVIAVSLAGRSNHANELDGECIVLGDACAFPSAKAVKESTASVHVMRKFATCAIAQDALCIKTCAQQCAGYGIEFALHSAAVKGMATLGVRRNMTCSEVGGVRNQTVNTQWNCLLSRTINGTEIVPGPLRVNGVRYTTL